MIPMRSNIKEITKITPVAFAESLIEILCKASFDKVDNSVCIVKEIHHNEEQNILTVTLSDSSVFHIKIK